MVAAAVLAVTGLLMAMGGVMGFVNRGSEQSLVAGLVSGVLLGYSARLAAEPKARTTGLRLGFVVSLLLSLIMLVRYWRSGVVMPAAVVSGLCGLCALFSGHALYAELHAPPKRTAARSE